ncbi:hypothetical protein JCM17380_33290 [Desulfosporosinus burensis]
MNYVPNFKPHNPNNNALLINRFKPLGFYLFLFAILSFQVVLIILTLFGNQVISPHLSLKLENFANLVHNNQYDNARTELNEINALVRGSINDSTAIQINEILANKFASITDQILLEKSEFQTYEFNNGITLFQKELLPIIDSQLKEVTKVYIDTGADYDKITYYLQNIEKLGFENSVKSYQNKLESYYQSRQNFATANQYFATNDYLKSIPLYQKVIPEDEKDFQVAQEKIKEGLAIVYPEYLAIAAALASEQQYKEAYDALQTISEYYPNDTELLTKLTDYKKAQAMVLYQGPIEHIFFHPLLAYPELAFDNDHQSKGFNDWFITVKEFKKILDSLYKNNYILIDIHAIFNNSEDGKPLTVRKDLLLPAGKKPLIISIDDLNYYEYMIPNGTVHKLILDEQGNISTFSMSPQGVPTTSRDNEIIPILDQFVQKHEDFSLNGAKGILALTGYEGILGYRTHQLDSPNFEFEKNHALTIIKRLKETGWSFASHGYGHHDARKVPLTVLTRDTQRWLTEVAPLTGLTDVYIYPFGSSVLPGDPKFQYLLDKGFKVLCAVGPNPYSKSGNDYLMMDRRHIDGMALQSQAALLKGFFESSEIIDEDRPQLIP